MVSYAATARLLINFISVTSGKTVVTKVTKEIGCETVHLLFLRLFHFMGEFLAQSENTVHRF